MLLARSMTESVVLLVLFVGTVATVVVIVAVAQPSGGVWTNVLKSVTLSSFPFFADRFRVTSTLYY